MDLTKIQKIYKKASIYDGCLLLPGDIDIRKLDAIRNLWGWKNWVFYGEDINSIDKSVIPELVKTITKGDWLNLRAYALKLNKDSIDAIPWIRYSKWV